MSQNGYKRSQHTTSLLLLRQVSFQRTMARSHLCIQSFACLLPQSHHLSPNPSNTPTPLHPHHHLASLLPSDGLFQSYTNSIATRELPPRSGTGKALSTFLCQIELESERDRNWWKIWKERLIEVLKWIISTPRSNRCSARESNVFSFIKELENNKWNSNKSINSLKEE